MKTRENELHEPFVDVFKSTSGDICVQTSCDVCGIILHDTWWWQFISEDDLKKKAIKETPKYCPNCGARLKEIEE